MGNPCIMGCESNEKSPAPHPGTGKVHTFRFPIKRHAHLLPKWERFVNRSNWNASSNTVLCHNHFDERFLNVSDESKRVHLDWASNPVPSIYVNEVFDKYPSLLPTPTTSRKEPRKRLFQEDEMPQFSETIDPVIHDVSDLENFTPVGFECRRVDDSILFYRIVFDEKTQFPSILESIKVDSELHVQLRYNGDPVPLPPWFVKGRSAKLTRPSMLENLPPYIRSIAEESTFTILEELKERKNYKPKGRPPYSAALLRFALHLRYTSAQAYRQLLEMFPLPSFSLLSKIQQGGVDAVKAIRLLMEKGKMSKDVILIVDEMFLQKGSQYQSGDFIGEDEEGNLYKGVVGFMIVGLKESVPYMIQALPETTFDGKWLAKKMEDNMKTLTDAGFRVRAVVTDNHSTNVTAFSTLLKRFSSSSDSYFTYPVNNLKTYLFYDNVHLMKNVRNNLLNGKKFVFPEFKFENNNIKISCPAGYITWGDLHKVHDRDAKLKGNLRKAPALTYQAMHPGNKKQSVPLALAIFDEKTITGCKEYFPNRQDMSSFLTVFNTWWMVANSKQKFHPTVIGNAAVAGDGKPEFFRAMADWIEEWQESPFFTLTPHTSSALLKTLRAQAMLIEDLLEEGYDYVRVARFQSDPIERRFSQYRQMSGGRFLVGLREVRNSERILACRSLILEDIDFWEEDIRPEKSNANGERVLSEIKDLVTEIQESTLDDDSLEVATFFAGYVGKKLESRSKCPECKSLFYATEQSVANDKYLLSLSRGGLATPSTNLAEFTADCFAILDYVSPLFTKHQVENVREVSTRILNQYGPSATFTCSKHKEWGRKFAVKPVVNSFFNNKQKLLNDTVRKDTVGDLKKLKRQKRK